MNAVRRLLRRLQSPRQALDLRSFEEARASIELHRRTIDDLGERQCKLEEDLAKLDREVQAKVASADRLSAIHVMKRRKLVLNEIHKIGNEKLQLENMLFSINSAIRSQIAIHALTDLQSRHASLLRTSNPHKVERLMDSIAQQQTLQTQIETLMSTDSTDATYADDLFEAELIHLEDIQLGEKISKIESAPITPQAVNTAQRVCPKAC